MARKKQPAVCESCGIKLSERAGFSERWGTCTACVSATRYHIKKAYLDPSHLTAYDKRLTACTNRRSLIEEHLEMKTFTLIKMKGGGYRLVVGDPVK